MGWGVCARLARVAEAGLRRKSWGRMADLVLTQTERTAVIRPQPPRRPKVFEGFAKSLENCGCKVGPIDTHHFESALWNGIKRASRIMSRHDYGESCDFTPSEEQRAALEIQEVNAGYGTKQKRAFNLPLWNKLQQEAKARKKERQAKAAKSQAEKPQREVRNEWQFNQHRTRSWERAYRCALADRTRKTNKTDNELLARVGLIAYGSHALKKSQLGARELFALAPADYIEHMAGMTKAELNRELQEDYHEGVFELEDLQALADRLGVDAAPHFRPTATLLACLTSPERQALAEELALDLPNGPKEAQAKSLAEHWPIGTVPDVLALPRPKSPRKGKKAK